MDLKEEEIDIIEVYILYCFKAYRSLTAPAKLIKVNQLSHVIVKIQLYQRSIPTLPTPNPLIKSGKPLLLTLTFTSSLHGVYHVHRPLL